jgi:hypothetical protein
MTSIKILIPPLHYVVFIATAHAGVLFLWNKLQLSSKRSRLLVELCFILFSLPDEESEKLLSPGKQPLTTRQQAE